MYLNRREGNTVVGFSTFVFRSNSKYDSKEKNEYGGERKKERERVRVNPTTLLAPLKLSSLTFRKIWGFASSTWSLSCFATFAPNLQWFYGSGCFEGFPWMQHGGVIFITLWRHYFIVVTFSLRSTYKLIDNFENNDI